MPLLDITMRLDDLIEKVDSINDRSDYACLDQVFEQEQIVERLAAIRVCVEPILFQESHRIFWNVHV